MSREAGDADPDLRVRVRGAAPPCPRVMDYIRKNIDAVLQEAAGASPSILARLLRSYPQDPELVVRMVQDYLDHG